MLLLAVDQDRLDVGGEQVPDHPEDEIALLVEDGARRGLGEPRLHLLPEADEELDVRAELRFPASLAHGAHDEPTAPGRPEAPDELPQAVALLRVVDPPGDAEVIHLGHVHEIAARQADERGDPRPLGAERLLRHLHEDLLALAEHVLDGRDHATLARGRGLGALAPLAVGGGILVEAEVRLLVLGEHHPLVLPEVGDEVAGVEEGVLGQADIDERGLHAGKDVGYDALVDVPDDRAMMTPLDEQLGEAAAVEDGDAGFADSGIDDDLACHGSVAPAETPRPPGPSRPPARPGRGRATTPPGRARPGPA